MIEPMLKMRGCVGLSIFRIYSLIIVYSSIYYIVVYMLVVVDICLFDYTCVGGCCHFGGILVRRLVVLE